MLLLRKLRLLPIFIIFLLFTPSNLEAQCACVWLDETGIKQCVLYPNCSGAFFSACATQTNGSNFQCLSGSDCTVYPGSTPGCNPQCLGNGACWYNGNKCVSSSICAIILPIGLIELKGKKVEDYNLITWKTAFESNNAYFVVSRSTDAKNWTEMVRLNGAGSSTNTISYSVKDSQPEIEINYYKITQVDFDGEAAEYGPISMDNSSEPRVLIKTVNLLGQEVDEFTNGFVFNCYSDGSTEKILR